MPRERTQINNAEFEISKYLVRFGQDRGGGGEPLACTLHNTLLRLKIQFRPLKTKTLSVSFETETQTMRLVILSLFQSNTVEVYAGKFYIIFLTVNF